MYIIYNAIWKKEENATGRADITEHVNTKFQPQAAVNPAAAGSNFYTCISSFGNKTLDKNYV